MNSSEYMHTTSVDEENGVYNYDCSGFVGYTLSRSDPGAHSELLNNKHSKEDLPEADDFYSRFLEFGTAHGNRSWMRVSIPLELLPGDIIVWLKPDSSNAKSTGHIMIASDYPIKNPERTGIVLIRVFDSTTSIHANDTRSSGQTGLGE